MPKSAFQFTQFSESHFHKIEPKLSSVDQDLDQDATFQFGSEFSRETFTHAHIEKSTKFPVLKIPIVSKSALCKAAQTLLL